MKREKEMDRKGEEKKKRKTALTSKAQNTYWPTGVLPGLNLRSPLALVLVLGCACSRVLQEGELGPWPCTLVANGPELWVVFHFDMQTNQAQPNTRHGASTSLWTLPNSSERAIAKRSVFLLWIHRVPPASGGLCVAGVPGELGI